MQKKVLLAIGNKQYSELLKRNFYQHKDFFSIANQEVLHHRFLEELVDVEKPDILLLHDYYLESDYVRPEIKEKEWQSFIRKMRVKYDDSLRMVFLCERPRGDLFLASLVSLGIKDIFNEHSINIDVLINQLKDTPRFSNVEKFIRNSDPVLLDIENDQESEDNKSDSKTEKPIVQKVIEKKVIQKVVNKNVIKRDYNIHVHNETEKVIGIPIKKKIVMIGSPLSRSGSTFVSHLLARKLTQIGVSTTYIESPFSKAYTFDRFHGERYAKDCRSKFYQFSKDANLSHVGEWKKDDVELICKHPTDEPIYCDEDVTFDNLIKVLFASQSTITIIDAGKDWSRELFQDFFDLADHMYFILEPDIPFIQYLEESKDVDAQIFREHLKWEKSNLIGNRFDKSLLENNLIEYLYEGKFKTIFPVFPVIDVFDCQMRGNFLNDYREYQKRIDPFIQPLLDDILPQEFMKKSKNSKGFFKGLFHKKITIEKTEKKEEEITK